MLPVSLAIRPGVDTQRTGLQNEGGISESYLIRFKNGLVQKRGGCQKLATDTFLGTARCLFPWADLLGNGYLGIGTNLRLEVLSSGNIYDITPIEHTSDLTNAFSTIGAQSIVTIADGTFSPGVGQFINIVTMTYIGGLILQGAYQVLGIGAGTYTIDAGIPAMSTVNNGGAVLSFTTQSGSNIVAVTLGDYQFTNGQTITLGTPVTVGGLTLSGSYTVTTTAAGPYGIGPYGTGAYGVGVSGFTISATAVANANATASENGGATEITYSIVLPVEIIPSGAYGSGVYGGGSYGIGSATTSLIDLVLWTEDKWGENLVAAYRGGPIYQWVPPVASGNDAEVVSGAPQAVNGIFTASAQQQLIAWGIYSASLGEQDPMLVGWTDVADLNDWTASATNQAGSFRLSTGSKIICGMWFGINGLLWTDTSFWAMSYVNFPFIFGFNEVGSDCGLIAQRAAAKLGTLVAWMSQNDFFTFEGGAVNVLPCTVRDFVFNNLDPSYVDAIFAAPNTYFDEIEWWFPTIGSSGVCSAYVKWNKTENLWDCGPLPAPPTGYSTLEVSAWCNQSILGPPIGAFYTGLLEQFETSNDFDGQVLDSWFTTGWFQLAQGEEFINLTRILPDFIFNAGGQVQITVYLTDYPNGDDIDTYGPFPVNAATKFFKVGARDRLCKLRIDCIAPNTFWRYGKPLAVIAADGRQ